MGDRAKRFVRLAFRVLGGCIFPIVLATASYSFGRAEGFRRGSEAMKEAIFHVVDRLSETPADGSPKGRDRNGLDREATRAAVPEGQAPERFPQPVKGEKA